MLDVSIYTQQLYENRILFTLFNSPLDSLFVNRETIQQRHVTAAAVDFTAQLGSHPFVVVYAFRPRPLVPVGGHPAS